MALPSLPQNIIIEVEGVESVDDSLNRDYMVRQGCFSGIFVPNSEVIDEPPRFGSNSIGYSKLEDALHALAMKCARDCP